jgi:hypothetical protein
MEVARAEELGKEWRVEACCGCRLELHATSGMQRCWLLHDAKMKGGMLERGVCGTSRRSKRQRHTEKKRSRVADDCIINKKMTIRSTIVWSTKSDL